MYNDRVMGMFLKPIFWNFQNFLADSNSIGLLSIIAPLSAKINDMGFIGDGVNMIIHPLYGLKNLHLRRRSMVKATINTFYMGRVIS
jgi:hypothetical protein